jgi:hypothetical protein
MRQAKDQAQGNKLPLATNDGGATWRDIAQYRKWPAPWNYVAYLAIVVILALALRADPRPGHTAPGIDDIKYSDSPLNAGEPDALGLGNLALALSRFLQNPKTPPRQTIAISGQWGSGKSSLMNLVKHDLEASGQLPVSFNAWHHQEEDHLLAALLQNIREQAIPEWWQLRGVRFRVALLRLRWQGYWPALLLFLTAASALAGYVTQTRRGRLRSIAHSTRSRRN